MNKTTLSRMTLVAGFLGSLSACIVPTGKTSSTDSSTSSSTNSSTNSSTAGAQDETSEASPGLDRSGPVTWKTNEDYADRVIADGDCLNASEKKMLERINQDRQSFTDEYLKAGKSEGLAQPLEACCDLVAAARTHSLDMMTRDFFAHENPDGLKPFDRVSLITDRFSGAGENIAWGGDVYGTEYMEDGFMDEPTGGELNHRGNILNPRFTHVGIGIVVQDGYVYVTQDFGIAKDETATYTRTRCWYDDKCTDMITSRLVTQDECKESLGGKGWGPDSSDCHPL